MKRRIDKYNVIDKEIEDKVTLWILRIIFRLNGAKELFDSITYFSQKDLLLFLGIIELSDEKVSEDNILKQLYEKHIILEQKSNLSSNTILINNIKKLSTLLGLNSIDEEILEFVILVYQIEILGSATSLLCTNFSTSKVIRTLSVILNCHIDKIHNAFSSKSKLNQTGLLTLFAKPTMSFQDKLCFPSDKFHSNMMLSEDNIIDIFKDSILTTSSPILGLNDYTHIQDDMNILIKYLLEAYTKKLNGVNILFYGLPGTGKTELARVIAETIHKELYEVTYIDEDDNSIEGENRLKAYKVAQSIFAGTDTLLLYDEAEDIFDSANTLFEQRKQKNKAWVNKMLETNQIPTIWITNDINSIDNAIVRRFSLAVELPIPSKKKRIDMIKRYGSDFIDDKIVSKIAYHESIAPSLLSQTSKILAHITIDNKESAFIKIINNTLKAQGYDEIQENDTQKLPMNYNTNFINCNTDLVELLKGIKKSQNVRICIYGKSGTGKSAFAQYVAENLDLPYHIKKGSDLLSRWIGGTERNIASAFQEAKEEKAVLIFDEVDSFLADRSSTSKNWEITQVNEMLVQIENFNGIFIATTNLMDNLDKASLRRFDLKLEFEYLKPNQSWLLFKQECSQLGIKASKIFEKDIKDLPYLTPGNFATVKRQNRFKKIKNCQDFYQRLIEEISIKHGKLNNKLGFRL